MYKSTESENMSKQSWLREGYRFSSTFGDRGMEIAIPPGQLPPFSTSERDLKMKELPPLPIQLRKHATANSSIQTAASHSRIQPIVTSISFNDSTKAASPSPSMLSSKAYSVPRSNSSPTQALPREDLPRDLQKLRMNVYGLAPSTSENRSMSHLSTESSESEYSQPEWTSVRPTGMLNVYARPPKDPQDLIELQTSVWAQPDNGLHSNDYQTSSARPEGEPIDSKFLQKTSTKYRKGGNAESWQEHRVYSHDSERDITKNYNHNRRQLDGALIPKSLIHRTTRPDPIAISSHHESTFLTSVRESFSWGVQGLISPNKQQHFNTPVTGTNTPGTPGFAASTIVPRSSSRDHRRLGSGKHPLKSPYPFKSTDDVSPISRTEPSEHKLRRNLSGAMRKMSQRRSLNRKNVIDTSVAVPESAGTPISAKLSARLAFSPKETFQRGNEHIQDAVTKARLKVNIKTSKERRRESLMKKIVVVGITDQSPGRKPPNKN